MALVPQKMIKKVTMIAMVFALVGVGMAWSGLILEQSKLTPLQEEYWTDYNKAERDAAEADSDLAQMKADIENLKPTILTMKLVGIATVLFGIMIVLMGILKMLSLMPTGLGDVLRANLEDMGLGKKE